MGHTVPFVALDRQHAPLRDELRAAFERVLASSAFVLGEEVARFEDDFAAYCGVRHCVGVGSGTAALMLALQAMGIGPGDEVIVPAHTFIASALGVLHAGATPVFCDVEDGTGLMSADAAASAVTPRTAGILPVHLYGQCCDMKALAEVAHRHGLAVLEDAAQAHGATYWDRRAGSLGTAAAFSFYPTKNLGALGDGGAICTDNDDIASRARALRNLGQFRRGEHELPGHNERLDALQAAFLRVKLPHLDSWNQVRRRHAATYSELLGGAFRLLAERPETPCIYHLFPVRTPARASLASSLSAAGVDTGIHYSPSVPEQPPFALTKSDFPMASLWASEELSLPMFAHMTPAEIHRVARICRARSSP